jgi:hypothetical protein
VETVEQAQQTPLEILELDTHILQVVEEAEAEAEEEQLDTVVLETAEVLTTLGLQLLQTKVAEVAAVA